MTKTVKYVVTLVAIVGVGIGAYFLWRQLQGSSFFSQTSTAEVADIHIENNLKTVTVRLNRDDVIFRKLQQQLTHLNPDELTQVVRILPGIPDRKQANGVFLRSGVIVSAHAIMETNSGLSITIFIDEELSPEDIAYEVTQNYFAAMLATDELRGSSDGQPTYENTHQLTAELVMESHESGIMPFIVEQKE